MLGLAIHSSYLPKVQERIDLRSRAGFWAAIDTPRTLAPRGEPLGFELLGHDGGSGHSWICNGVERWFQEEKGIGSYAAGLLPAEETADACLAYIYNEYLRAEPVPWFPWLLLRYPLTSTGSGGAV